jgi:predicted DNA-binding transcriptional regulator YafY
MSYHNQKNDFKQQNDSRSKMHYSPNLIDSINNAIQNHKMATIEYEARDFEISMRDIEPMALLFKHNKRNIVGYCHLRNEYRTFRLDRINMIKVNQATFTPRQDFNLSDFENDDDVVWTKNEEE